MADSKTYKTYRVAYDSFISTKDMQKTINRYLQDIINDNKKTTEKKPKAYYIIFDRKSIDGVAIHEISQLLLLPSNLKQKVELVFDHCNIKNLDFTNIYLEELPIRFLNCSIDRISLVKSSFMLVEFSSCNIFCLQVFDCYFNDNGLAISGCFINNTEIKCCKFKDLGFAGSNLDNCSINYSIIPKADFINTIFGYFCTKGNSIEWVDSNIVIGDSLFINMNDADIKILAISGVGISTFYYMPDIEIVKNGFSTWTFKEFEEYVDSLDRAYNNSIANEKNRLRMQSHKTVLDYITKIREDYKDTKALYHSTDYHEQSNIKTGLVIK